MGTEKRRFTRFNYKMPAELEIEGKTYRVNEISNLGMGGCLLPIRIDAKSGTPCELRINLGISGDEPVVLIGGEILRKKDNKTAIKFITIDPESLHHLHQIARYNSPDPDIVDKEIKKHPGIV
jgi:hypothetical protein